MILMKELPVTISCCTWALSGEDRSVLSQLAGAGYRSIDIRPFDYTSEESGRYIKDSGMTVSCMGLCFGMPEAASLDSDDESSRGRAIAYVSRALEYAASRGVKTAYVVPGMDSGQSALSRYATALSTVADKGQSLGLRICIEHFPGRALPTVTKTLDFLAAIDHPNLFLLFDTGHAQISREDPVTSLHTAGSRLGYVHLDDNDGQQDLHLSLFDGVMTELSLRQTLLALKKIKYGGPVSLELHPSLSDPLLALKQSREIVDRMAMGI